MEHDFFERGGEHSLFNLRGEKNRKKKGKEEKREMIKEKEKGRRNHFRSSLRKRQGGETDVHNQFLLHLDECKRENEPTMRKGREKKETNCNRGKKRPPTKGGGKD